jgi:hypothetical protein
MHHPHLHYTQLQLYIAPLAPPGTGGGEAKTKYDEPHFAPASSTVMNGAYNPNGGGGGRDAASDGYLDVNESASAANPRHAFEDAGFVADEQGDGEARSFRRKSVHRTNPLMLDDGEEQGGGNRSSEVDGEYTPDYEGN